MPAFPSLEWFSSLREAVNEDSGFRSLGTNDTKFGIKVDEDVFEVTFDGFECTDVKQIDDDTLRDSDFFIDMPLDRWHSLIENIRANSGADFKNTLNTLDITEPDGIIKAQNEFGRMAFLRYHLSVQRFFDAAANVETSFG